MNLEDAPDALTVEETASVLSISRGLAYEGIRRGDIPHVRIGARVIRVPKARLQELLGADAEQGGAPTGDA